MTEKYNPDDIVDFMVKNYEKMDIKSLRENLDNEMSNIEKQEIMVGDEEVFILYGQFCNYATLLLLRTYADDKFDNKHQANSLLNDIVTTFLKELKTNYSRINERYEMNQEKDLQKVLGQDLLNRYNNYSSKKINAIIETLKKRLTTSLSIDEISRKSELGELDNPI